MPFGLGAIEYLGRGKYRRLTRHQDLRGSLVQPKRVRERLR